MSLLPNFVNLDPLYTGNAWDPQDEYSVCKDWGSTGWMYDTTQISKDNRNLAGFHGCA